MRFRAARFLFVFFPLCAPAQKNLIPRIDSLTRQLNDPHSKGDINKVTVLYELCRYYRTIDYTKGIAYGEQSLELAEKIHWAPGIATAEQNLAACYWAKSDYVYALTLAQKALEIRQEAHDTTTIPSCLITIGSIVYAENQYEKALDYFKQAVAMHPEDGVIWEDIAMTYAVMNEPDQAAECFHKAMIVFQNQGKALNAEHSLSSMGNALTSQGKYAEAAVDLHQAVDLARQLNDSAGLELDFEWLGILERAQGHYQQAINLIKKAHTLMVALGDQGELASNDNQLGITYLLIAKGQGVEHSDALQRKQAIGLAVDYFKQAVTLARAVSTWNTLLEYEKHLCEASILDQQPGEASLALEQYAAFSDSLFNKETERKFTENLLSYDFHRQRDSLSHQAVLEHLHRKQDLTYAILAVAVIVLAALGFLFMNRIERLRLKSRLNDVTLSALRSQMNPHFIFNCLNSIKLYTEQNDSAAASAYLTKFSRLIRVMLQNSRSETIPLSSELELLQLYLEMEALRFKDKLHFDIDLSPEVSADFIEIPSMLIQPYVENAIWHGLMHKENGGHIHIRVGEMPESPVLAISIRDDGIGRAAAQSLRSKTATLHKSFGIKLTDERIRLVNEKYKTHAAVVIEDLFDPEGRPAGTLVTINIPLK